MYQSEMKENFIKDYMKSRVVAKTSLYSLFRKTERYEGNLNKDCCQFTKDEALKMYEEFQAKSVYVLLNYNVILKAYCAWQKYYNGLDTEIAYEEINKEMLSPLIPESANKILSRGDITDIEDQLLNWTDKAIVEALFEGIAGKNMEDIYAVSKECIQGDYLIVNGKKFILTERLNMLLSKAFAETEMMSYGKTMKVIPVTGYGRIYKERFNTIGVNTEDSIFRFFYRKIQIFRNYLDIPGLTMKGIQSAGLWHYLQIGMEETNLDLRNFLKTEMGKELAVRYGFSENYYVENITSKYERYLE